MNKDSGDDRMKQVIINADDFGIHESINNGILTGHRHGAISSTTIIAAGEAFDKVARAIGLGYPGGPKIEKKAKEGNPDAIHFPRAKISGGEYDFSFSGLKSAVLNYVNGCNMRGEVFSEADVAASFQKAVIDVLVEHAIHAVMEHGENKLAIAGGVASNLTLRNAMIEACEKSAEEYFQE